MNESPLIGNKRTKEIVLARGFEEYKLDINSIVSQSSINAAISSYFTSVGGIQNCADVLACIANTESAVSEEQHFGAIATITQDSAQTFTFVSLGFPPVISLTQPPRIIYHADRAIILESYSNTSITLRSSAAGVANTPFNVGIELVGNINPIPNYIYDPIISGMNIKNDKSFSVSFWNSEKIILKGMPYGVANYPVTCGVFITGKRTADGEFETWYIEMELEEETQTFAYEDVNIGKTDIEIHGKLITLESESNELTFGELGFTPVISDARVSGLVPGNLCNVYVYSISDTGVTLNLFVGKVDNPPVRAFLEIRGG